MITISGFIAQLKILLPTVKFYNGSIDRNEKQCVGVFARGNAAPYRAIGGATNTTFSTLPVSILVHWSENANTCEEMANSIFGKLLSSNDMVVAGKRVILLDLLDSAPVNIDRDENNVCEMVIRLNIYYER